jgi:hypothetical protein
MQKKKEAKIIPLDYEARSIYEATEETCLSANESEAVLLVLNDLIREYIQSLKDLEQLMAKETEEG